MSQNKSVKAVSELKLKCYFSKPDEIVKIEKALRQMGLPILADIAKIEGENKCGVEEYAEISKSIK